jgi:hypothetical protein
VNVIAISGGGQDYLATATLLGAAKVLVKPFPIAGLIAAINELMPGDVYLLEHLDQRSTRGCCAT